MTGTNKVIAILQEKKSGCGVDEIVLHLPYSSVTAPSSYRSPHATPISGSEVFLLAGVRILNNFRIALNES